MLEDAALAFAVLGHPIDKSRAVMVGNNIRDAQAAAAFGIPAILVATTHPRGVLERNANAARLDNVLIVGDLPEAVALIQAGIDG